jgi:hypothetical protein
LPEFAKDGATQHRTRPHDADLNGAFQLISRDRYETGSFDGVADTQATATFSGPGTIDKDESG